jgi:hypothetical protein
MLPARAVTITLIGAGPVNDGVDYVLPYELTINGLVTYADCYDFFDWVQIGESWQANELTLSEAASAGQFSGANNSLLGYEEVAWLSSQTTSTAQNQIDLQHDIWNVFDPGQFTITAGMQTYLDGLAQAQLYFSISDLANFSFIEGIPAPGTSLPQAFVIYENQSTGGEGGASPEPDAAVLLITGLGLILISIVCGNRKRRGDNKKKHKYVLHPAPGAPDTY